MTVTGRIDAGPSEVWHDEVLAPQFAYEAEHLLGHYVAIERVLLQEYVRMGLATEAEAADLDARLDTLDAAAIRADPQRNMSDISFAVEQHVQSSGPPPFPAWHVDRSRNDAQACAQLLAGRELLAGIATQTIAFGTAVTELAGRYADTPMPGYTHGQAAQVISPGFHLAALAAETVSAVRAMLFTYDEIDACPLGAGTMAGQELPWDRDRMARLLGFARAQPHALVAVASRTWAARIADDLGRYAVVLSRFTTDLMTFSGAGFGFLDLTDDLAGISAAMPQKRNFPILERIRGRCAQVFGRAADVEAGQRNTPYANTVEVSKEAGGQLRVQADAMRSVLRLAGSVVAGASFRVDRMRAACAEDYLGGMTLANRLTLQHRIPWRTAQIIAGRYVREAIAQGIRPDQPDAALLQKAAETLTPDEAAELLSDAFDADAGLTVKQSTGSTHPDQVRALLAAQQAEFGELAAAWRSRVEGGPRW